MKINILNASEKFNHVLDVLESKTLSSLSDIQNYVTLPKLDIVISPCSEEYKTKSGIMGCVTTPYLIDIMLDTDRKDIIDVINDELPAVIAHEIHHAVRANSGIEDKTLFQVLIAEGLACHFETKFNGNKLPLFFDEIKQHEWRELYNKMESQFNEMNFDYPLYFGGEDETIFPNRAGYWVGFNVVSEYIEKNGGCAATLVNTSADSIAAI
ncbi:hypothetical protein VT06_01455 [Arsukibacterium sp. MJ3]|nr:hypothetical protein VT06_01455 [Arsukibacterium sp. MJ3]